MAAWSWNDPEKQSQSIYGKFLLREGVEGSPTSHLFLPDPFEYCLLRLVLTTHNTALEVGARTVNAAWQTICTYSLHSKVPLGNRSKSIMIIHG